MPRKLWLFIAFVLMLWACMIFAAGTIVFALDASEPLSRYPGCYAFGTPVWRYGETDTSHLRGYTHMSQRARVTFEYICYPPGT